MTAAAFVIGAFRDDLAGYVRAVVTVYTILIIAYILSSLFLQFGRIPYARWSSAVLGFLRDVCEPYLSVFRRFIPSFGPLDFSPVVAIFVLQIIGGIVARVIQG
jgi:YggT family protein